MNKTEKIIQTICYLLKSIKKKQLGKVHLIKLLFFADKYHLLRYGGTISEDDYYAMVNGPVASTAKDVLDLDADSLDSFYFKMVKNLIVKKYNDNGYYHYTLKEKAFDYDYDLLSETDVESLNFVIKNMGSWNKTQLVEYSHKYPEWIEHEKFLKENPGARSGKIYLEDMFSTFKGDILAQGLTEEDIKCSKELALGQEETDCFNIYEQAAITLNSFHSIMAKRSKGKRLVLRT